MNICSDLVRVLGCQVLVTSTIIEARLSVSYGACFLGLCKCLVGIDLLTNCQALIFYLLLVDIYRLGYSKDSVEDC